MSLGVTGQDRIGGPISQHTIEPFGDGGVVLNGIAHHQLTLFFGKHIDRAGFVTFVPKCQHSGVDLGMKLDAEDMLRHIQPVQLDKQDENQPHAPH